MKKKSTPHVTAANTAYALLLGFLCGARGALLFHTFWTDLLEAPEHRLHEFARQASSWGWLTYRGVGNIVEIDFPCLLTPQERRHLVSKIDLLLHNYERHVALPWYDALSGLQKVWFAVYDKTDERRLRARIDAFDLATKKAAMAGACVISPISSPSG